MPIRHSRRDCWTQDENFYKKMLKHHVSLWKFLEAFVRELEVKSILEIGGGTGLVSEWCPGSYLNIERNPNICNVGRKRYPEETTHARFICDDFTRMDTRRFQHNHFDLVLAAAVIEHCSDYREFIRKALDVDSAYVIITFFRGLLWEADRHCRIVGPQGSHYENRYRAEALMEWMHTEGIDFQIRTIKGRITDAILVIDAHGGRDVIIGEAFASVGRTDKGYGKCIQEKRIAERLKQKQRKARLSGDAKPLQKKKSSPPLVD